MTRFEDVVAAFAARERAGIDNRRAHELCALELYRAMRAVGGASGGDIQPAPFVDYPAEGVGRIHDFMAFVGDWFQLQFKFQIESPNTQRPREIIFRLQLRRERDQWAVKFHEDMEPVPFDCADSASVSGVCEKLYDLIIAWLQHGTPQDEGPRQIGFHASWS